MDKIICKTGRKISKKKYNERQTKQTLEPDKRQIGTLKFVQFLIKRNPPRQNAKRRKNACRIEASAWPVKRPDFAAKAKKTL